MKISRALFPVLLLFGMQAAAIDVKEATAHIRRVEYSLQPLVEQQKEHNKQEVEKVKSQPGYVPDYHVASVRQAIIEILGESLKYRWSVVNGASIMNTDCARAVEKYMAGSFPQLKQAYDDYKGNKSRQFTKLQPLIMANSLDGFGFLTGPVAMCGH